MSSPLWLMTGASRGLGRAFALRLAREGARLALAARSADDLAETAELATAGGAPEVRTWIADLSRPDAAARLAADVEASQGPCFGLINNAGFASSGDVVDTRVELLLDQLAVNLGSVLTLTRRIAPGMVRRRSGIILNVSSMAGFQAVPTQAVYAATKAWVLSFSCALHDELATDGVTVTALCPGLTRTAFFEAAGIDLRRRFARWGTWMSASAVAACGLRAARRRRLVVVPGFLNAVPIALQRIVPRPLVARLTAGLMRA